MDENTILHDYTHNMVCKYSHGKSEISNNSSNMLKMFLEHQLNLILVSNKARIAFLSNQKTISLFQEMIIMIPSNVKSIIFRLHGFSNDNILYYNSDLVTDEDLEFLHVPKDTDFYEKLGTILGYHRPWKYPILSKEICVSFTYKILYPFQNSYLKCFLYAETSDSQSDDVILSAFRKHKSFENVISQIFKNCKGQLKIKSIR